MSEASSDAALRSLAREALAVGASHRPVIATDADGTLWEGDIGDDLFVEALSHHPVGPTALADLRASAGELLGPDAPASLDALAHAFIAAYRAGRVGIERICQVQSEVLGDRTRAELDALLALVGARVAARVRPAVRVILDEAARVGVPVHVVTGSLGDAVAAALRGAGLAVASVAGAELQTEGDRVLPRLARPIPLHGGKVDALRAAGAWAPALGLGDGGWDATFLRGCARPLLVHPSDALLDAMRSVEGVMILRDGAVSPRRPDT